jgi:hypothetical protein
MQDFLRTKRWIFSWLLTAATFAVVCWTAAQGQSQGPAPLREPINDILLRLRQDGTCEELYDRWFGSQ